VKGKARLVGDIVGAADGLDPKEEEFMIKVGMAVAYNPPPKPDKKEDKDDKK
jgi:hypothetical protein